MPNKCRDLLKKYWGYDRFRPTQEKIINEVMNGRDVLALLPTGGGKSLCFQVPALSRDGICLVISPLIALMKDQVTNLQKRNIPSEAIYSGIPNSKVNQIIDAAKEGTIKFLYISPERLKSESFIFQLRQLHLQFVAVDEAHCISQWGYDFRPAYLTISYLRSLFNDIQIVALTATATPDVVSDIVSKLGMKDVAIIKDSFYRKNLTYYVLQDEDKVEKIEAIIHSINNCGLIYVNSRRKAVELSNLMQQKGIRCDYYHAGLTLEDRMRRQSMWIENKVPLMICTNAFGMGIDKPDVRYVIHYDIPLSIEHYFQEAGRGGRDLKQSFAFIFSNKNSLKELLDKKLQYPSIEDVKKVIVMLYNYCKIPFEAGKMESFPFSIADFCSQYKLEITKARKSIEIAIENEYIELNEAYFKPAQIHVLLDQNQIQTFYKRVPKYELFLKQIIRSFEGVFFQLRDVDLMYFARKHHYAIEEFYSYLKYLDKHEIIQFVPQSNQASIRFLIDKMPEHKMMLDGRCYLERKKVYEQQIDSMYFYLTQNDKCRSQVLLDYFGEPMSPVCHKCDIDSNSKSNSLSDKEILELKEKMISFISTQKEVSFDAIVLEFSFASEQLLRKILDRLMELEIIVKKDFLFYLK